MTRYHARENTQLLLDALESMPVVVLSGMRQSGKSTLIQHLPVKHGFTYKTFDDLNTLEAARLNPDTFLEQGERIIIDEAQRFPEIMNFIKKSVDLKRKNGRFILSGSSNFLLLKNISESLAGRAIYLELHPFNRREVLGKIKSKPVFENFLRTGDFKKQEGQAISWQEIITGGMPSVCLKEVKKPEIWFKGYEQTYLERDIRMLSQVADLVSFGRLLRLTALRTGQVLNLSDLGRDAKLNAVTTGRYLSLMETSFVISRLSPYLKNPVSRIIKAPKIYFSDTGLAAYLCAASKIDSHEPLKGRLFENYIIQNLQSILAARVPDARIYYWNIQGRSEVDLIVEDGLRTYAIEVKYGSQWRSEDLKGLDAFISSSKNCKVGMLVYNGKELTKFSDKIWIVPASILLQ